MPDQDDPRPAGAAPQAAAGEPPEDDGGAQFAHLKDATIMMVDDEPITTEVIQAFLEDDGYHDFVTTDRSVEALELIERHRPDVLLLDLMMPDVSGFDILEGLRASRRFRHMPTIMLTSSVDSETRLRALELGATDFLAKPVDPSELTLRLRNALAAKAYQDQLANRDELTGLVNRRTFVDRVSWALTRAAGHEHVVSVLHVGLDGFRRVNDEHGLGAGDAILAEVAQRLKDRVTGAEAADAGGDDPGWRALSRVGGDEFCVLLVGIPDADAAAGMARALLGALERPIGAGGVEVPLTASIGISAYPEDASDVDSLLAGAAAALAAAKSGGGGSYRFHSAEVDARSSATRALAAALATAVEEEQFMLQYQPRVSVATGRVTELEALVRWQHPERGLIGPHDFMEVAEDTGLVVPMGEWVIREACRQCKAWESSGLGAACVGVNLSARQLRAPGLPAAVSKALEETGLAPDRLRLEFTESTVMDDIDLNLEVIRTLKGLGVRLSIDHFGTGFFSLSRLKQLPVDELKLDRSFFGDTRADSDDSIIVGAIISMAHDLGLRVGAESVETADQYRFLKARGCDSCQGYLISRPLDGEAIAARAREKFSRTVVRV